ncbi:hypothetical protein MAR_026932 [Mya arenaria]|uniref:FAD dependent oxidoreductase domain-containing protein n=1 Tax=Mya arenaria TaxID=6604 RepID=A0ABY7EU43_MYAAR|nr:hypothetical protein MAR_026932 [Mya arenaria]
MQKRLPSAKVTIYADRFDNETTSHGAGGLFRPNVEHLLGVDPDTVTYGYQVTTVITYVPVFLPWLMVKFKDNGGRVEKRTVKSLEEEPGSGWRQVCIPRTRYDEVSIGGIRQKDNFNLEIDPKDTEGIKERCYKLWPSLKVVHNYGHGALGITLAWGTSIDAANLVVEGLTQPGSKL